MFPCTVMELQHHHFRRLVGIEIHRSEQFVPAADPQSMLSAACAFLKQNLKFERLSTVTAVDRYPSEPRFELVYHVHSVARNERLRLKCHLSGDNPEIDSVTVIWRSANWYEREVFDLFGIRFRNHPDLRRILMPDEWEGHPLRKDYPITGVQV